MELEIIMLSETRFRKTKVSCFLSFVEKPKGNHIYKSNMAIYVHIYTHIYIHTYDLFVIVELFMRTREKQRGRENDIELIVSKHIASV
jgi:hypothetical protein